MLEPQGISPGLIALSEQIIRKGIRDCVRSTVFILFYYLIIPTFYLGCSPQHGLRLTPRSELSLRIRVYTAQGYIPRLLLHKPLVFLAFVLVSLARYTLFPKVTT